VKDPTSQYVNIELDADLYIHLILSFEIPKL